MESCTIELSRGAINNNKLNVHTCGLDFFPPGIIGGPTKDTVGTQVTINAAGLTKPIKTDIPSDKNTGKPRWFLRERAAVGNFYRSNTLTAGDAVVIRRLASSKYELVPLPRKLRFIDLFAGIGGTRIAFEKAGCQCVFSSEWDRFAQQTYEANFGEKPHGDIRNIPSSEIPDHDILVAGFPCQPFSISGITKKNALGRPHGFDDLTQGTLFFELKRIINDKKPMAFLLENVKHLKRHDQGRTFQVIMHALADELGYDVHEEVFDAVDYVPQHASGS